MGLTPETWGPPAEAAALSHVSFCRRRAPVLVLLFFLVTKWNPLQCSNLGASRVFGGCEVFLNFALDQYQFGQFFTHFFDQTLPFFPSSKFWSIFFFSPLPPPPPVVVFRILGSVNFPGGPRERK